MNNTKQRDRARRWMAHMAHANGITEEPEPMFTVNVPLTYEAMPCESNRYNPWEERQAPLDGGRDEMTLDEIAAELGICRQRVSQLLASALRKLKKHMRQRALLP